jgi:hypothetical protein
MNKDQTNHLLVLFKITIAPNEAAAPISNAIAKVIANQLGLDNLKKSIT